jgi:hypothetical protein
VTREFALNNLHIGSIARCRHGTDRDHRIAPDIGARLSSNMLKHYALRDKWTSRLQI